MLYLKTPCRHKSSTEIRNSSDGNCAAIRHDWLKSATAVGIFDQQQTEKLFFSPFSSIRIRLRIFLNSYRQKKIELTSVAFLSSFLAMPIFSAKLLAIRIQDLDTRIIIGSFSDEIAPKIFCEVSWKIHESQLGGRGFHERPPKESSTTLSHESKLYI